MNNMPPAAPGFQRNRAMDHHDAQHDPIPLQRHDAVVPPRLQRIMDFVQDRIGTNEMTENEKSDARSFITAELEGNDLDNAKRAVYLQKLGHLNEGFVLPDNNQQGGKKKKASRSSRKDKGRKSSRKTKGKRKRGKAALASRKTKGKK